MSRWLKPNVRVLAIDSGMGWVHEIFDLRFLLLCSGTRIDWCSFFTSQYDLLIFIITCSQTHFNMEVLLAGVGVLKCYL